MPVVTGGDQKRKMNNSNFVLFVLCLVNYALNYINASLCFSCLLLFLKLFV